MKKPKPNKHGVYEERETVRVPMPKRCSLDINLVQVDADEWRWGYVLQAPTFGSSYPVSARFPNDATTREAAICGAVQSLKVYLLGMRDDVAAKLAAAIDAWMEAQKQELLFQ